MITLSVKYDDRIVTYDHLSYIDMTELPYIFFEVNGIRDIIQIVLDDSVLSFSLVYERNSGFSSFLEDCLNPGTFEIVDSTL